jgi:sigma-B regulation protein RsbQ
MSELPADLRRRHFVQESGEGPTLLYAHGFGCTQTVWGGILPAFAGTHRQIVFDHAGAGRADPMAFDPQRHANLDGYVEDLLALSRAIAPAEGLTLVAHSVSCSIGMVAAVREPTLFQRLVLLGPNPCFVNHPPDYEGGFARHELASLLDLMDRNYLGWSRYFAPIAAGVEGDTVVSATLLAGFGSTDPVMARTFAAATLYADCRPIVPRVRVPTVVLQHANDALAPMAVGRWLAANLPDGTLEVLAVPGHCAHISHPGLVADAIRRHLHH